MARIELSNIGGGTTLSLTTTGTSGASTLAGSVLNIPVYQGQLTLTTTGTSGAATLAGDILNIPNYATGGTPAGSTGEIQYNNAGAFAASSNLAWDNSATQLNIGAPSAPTGKLNVKGAGATSSTVNLRLTNSGNTELLKVLDNGVLNIGTNFYWDNVNSRLGINTTNPAAGLHVSGTSGRINNILIGSVSNTAISNTNADVVLNLNNGLCVATSTSIAASARLHVRGSNTSSGTNALLVQNSTPSDIYKIENDGKISYWATNTAAGTTGAQTINRPSGTVNFAAGATALVVTNSLCTTASIVFATVRTNDATATIKNVVPAAGSFTINLGAAATAETSVGFFIIN